MPSDNVVFWEVDTQADFMLPGGALYVPGAEKTIPNLKRLVDAARAGRVLLISSTDWHTPDDLEFKQFPPHCVRETPGAQIVPGAAAETRLTVPNDPNFALPNDFSGHQQIVLQKQTLDVFDNPLTSMLVDRLGRKPEFVVFGVVTEYCVRLAAKGLLERGRKVALVRDAIETLEPAAGKKALEELTHLGARLITTDQALALVGLSKALAS